MTARSTKVIYGALLLIVANSAVGVYCAYYPPSTPVPVTLQHLLNILYALVVVYFVYYHTSADDAPLPQQYLSKTTVASPRPSYDDVAL